MKKITLLMFVFFAMLLQGQNKLLSSITEIKNNGSWQKQLGYNYEYDTNNNLIKETEFVWNTANNEWRISYQTTYTYNANNKMTQEVQQKWDDISNSLQNSEKETYTYTNGYFTEQISEEWVSSQWKLVNKFSIANTNNLPGNAIDYIWDGSNWINDIRTTVTYNSNNKVLVELAEDWKSGQWINSDKSLSTYDANNRKIAEEDSKWDEINSVWVNDNTDTYNLDSYGNLIRNTYIDGDGSQGKVEYTYDTSVLLSSFAHPFRDKNGLEDLFEGYQYVNKILSENYFTYNTLTSNYEETSRTTYDYNNSIVLAVEKPELANATITPYPNPTTSILNINFSDSISIDKIVVIDNSGKIVLQQNQNTTQINVEKLSTGLYILEVCSGNKKYTTKFVKK